MRFVRYIDYDALERNEETGWRPIYEWKAINKLMRKINHVLMATIVTLALVFNDFLKNGFDTAIRSFSRNDIISTWHYTVSILLLLLIYFVIIVPVHELLHLLAYTPRVFSDKCFLVFDSGSVGAFFDGEIKKMRFLISSVLPLSAISLLFIVLSFAFTDSACIPFLFLLYMNLYGSYSDVMMFFYVLKKIPKDAIIYGNRYKMKGNIHG